MDIKSIANAAGVSPATVSRVLNNKNVSENTRRKVLSIIESIGYVPNYTGRSLRTKQSKRLMVILPSINNVFYAPIADGFETKSRELGYSTIFAVTNRRPELETSYYEMLYSKQVDGIASCIPSISIDRINTVAKSYPYVAICWRATESFEGDYVCIDNEQASYELTNFLIQLGHKSIAILNGENANRPFEKERQNGFLRAMRDAGLPVDKNYIRICEYSFEDAYEQCAKLMELPTPPTAISTFSDERAIGCINHLTKHGYLVGKDIDVVGFDNSRLSIMSIPPITTISQPCKEIGQEAARLLIERINDLTKPGRGVILRHKLIIRESTRSLQSSQNCNKIIN